MGYFRQQSGTLEREGRLTGFPAAKMPLRDGALAFSAEQIKNVKTTRSHPKARVDKAGRGAIGLAEDRSAIRVESRQRTNGARHGGKREQGDFDRQSGRGSGNPAHA